MPVPKEAWWKGRTKGGPVKRPLSPFKKAKAEAKKRGPGRHTIDGFEFLVDVRGRVMPLGKTK